MHWVVLAGAYIILWFLMLQILLPIGIRMPHESGEPVHAPTDTGAPANPRILLKAAIASAAAAIIWAVFYGFILADVIRL